MLAVRRPWSVPFTLCEARTRCALRRCCSLLCAYQLSGNQRCGPQRMLPPPGPTEAEQNSRMSGVHIEDRRAIWLGLGIVQLLIVWHFLALGCLQEKEFPELRNTWHLDEIILGFNVIELGRVWYFSITVSFLCSSPSGFLHPEREMKRCSPCCTKAFTNLSLLWTSMLETCRPDSLQSCTLAKICQDCEPLKIRFRMAVVLHVSSAGATSRV